MHDVVPFALVVVVAALALLAAVGSSRISEWVRVPTPGASSWSPRRSAPTSFPDLGSLSIRADQRIVTVALVADPLRRRHAHRAGAASARSPARVVWLGVAGTFVTAGALAVARPRALRLRLARRPARRHRARADRPRRRLLGARPPRGRRAHRHPARGRVRRQRPGRHRADARDPRRDRRRAGAPSPTAPREFALQMVVGHRLRGRRRPGPALAAAAPAAAQRGALPAADGRVRAAACTASRRSRTGPASWPCCSPGSWSATPARRTSARSSASPRRAGSLGEIVAFTVLGLSIPISDAFGDGRGWTGLALAALLILRGPPAASSGCCSLPIRLRRGERAFVLWAGLKGAVPILLGTYVVAEGVAGADRIYARDLRRRAGVGGRAGRPGADASPGWWHVPMRVVEPEPWALGMRFRDEPEGLHRFVVAARLGRRRLDDRATSRSRRTCGSAWSAATAGWSRCRGTTVLAGRRRGARPRLRRQRDRPPLHRRPS